MKSPPPLSRENLIRLSLLFILIAVIAFYWGAYYGTSQSKAQKPAECPVVAQPQPLNCEDFTQQVQQRLAEEGVFPYGEPIHAMQATVTSVDGKSFQISFPESRLDFLKTGTSTKTVQITDKTVIRQDIPKPSAQYEEERVRYDEAQAVFQNAISKPMTEEESKKIVRPLPPSPTATKILRLKDLRPGDQVMVNSQEDLRLKNSFQAETVILVSRPKA